MSAKIDERKYFAMLGFSQDLRLEVAGNMTKFGGSFVQGLAQCLLRADSSNLVKLVGAFPEYFLEYHPDKWRKDK